MLKTKFIKPLFFFFLRICLSKKILLGNAMSLGLKKVFTLYKFGKIQCLFFCISII